MKAKVELATKQDITIDCVATSDMSVELSASAGSNGYYVLYVHENGQTPIRIGLLHGSQIKIHERLAKEALDTSRQWQG